MRSVHQVFFFFPLRRLARIMSESSGSDKDDTGEPFCTKQGSLTRVMTESFTRIMRGLLHVSSVGSIKGTAPFNQAPGREHP